jgi:hypothetical protein
MSMELYTHARRHASASETRLAAIGVFAQTDSMATKTPREVLEWLCRGRDDLLHENGDPNFYQLSRLIQQKTDRTLSQATLHRLWTGTVKEMRGPTVDTLALFFEVPESVIRGELSLPHIDSLGMDITLAEVQILERMRRLKPEHRQLVDAQIKALEPEKVAGEAPKGTSSVSHMTDRHHPARKVR